MGLMIMLLLATGAFAAPSGKPLATPFGDNNVANPTFVQRSGGNSLDALGDIVNFNSALANGASYLRNSQSSTDGGWDWVLTSPNFAHSASASPLNLYGVCALGTYYDYLRTSNAADMTAMTLAANTIIGNAGIRDASALKFLMLYQDLSGVPANTYKDAARAKYDAYRTAHGGTGTALAEYIRDNRGISQGYHNGIIGWDLGGWAVAADMLNSRYGGNGYDTDADQIADVAYNASFVTNANYFDLVRCAGWDASYTNTDFYWYTLGVSGLIDAFRASNTHTTDIAGLVLKLEQSQTSFGAICGSYGVHANDDDWQSSAYAVMTLAALNPVTYATDINHAAYYIGATQDPAHGAWIYSDNTHYPEVGGENTSALYFGAAPSEVWVDDDFNAGNAGGHVWGYDAFSTIQNGINGVHGSTVNVAAGTYEEQVHITTNNLHLVGAGVGSTIINSPLTLPLGWTTSVANHPIVFVDGATGVEISNLTVNGLGRGQANYRFMGIGYWNAGGAVSFVHITGIRENPANGNQSGVGFYAYNTTGGPYAITVSDMTVDDYQKGGVVMNGAGLTGHVLRTTTTGYGPVNFIAQNGIQFGYGATGTIDNCTVTGHHYFGPVDDTSAGILLYQASAATTNSTVSDNQENITTVDANGSVTNSVVTANDSTLHGVYLDNEGSARSSGAPRRVRAFEEADARGNGNLDTDHSFTVSGCTFIGASVPWSGGITAGSFGSNLSVTVQNNTIRNWGTGVVLYTNGGTITNPLVTNNTFSNIINAIDDRDYVITPGLWTSNCYSDFGSNAGFGSNQYWIYNFGNYNGGSSAHTATDFNPNVNGCSNVDVIADHPYVGCSGTCANDVIYLTVDQTGYASGRVYLQLSNDLDVDWATDVTYPGAAHNVYPATGAAPNLQSLSNFARRTAAHTIEVDFQWASPYSTGAGYIAAIPVRSTGPNAAVLGVAGVSSEFYPHDLVPPNPPVTNLILGSTSVTVDCNNASTLTFGWATTPTCGVIRTAADLVDKFHVQITPPAGYTAFDLPASAYVDVNGTHIPVNFTGSPVNVTWPASGQAAAVFAALHTDCSADVMTLHTTDAGCNEATLAISLTPTIRVITALLGTDIQYPAGHYYLSGCYNADRLRAALQNGDVLIHFTGLSDACGTVPGDLVITMDFGTEHTIPLSDVTHFPVTDAEKTALADRLLDDAGPSANGESHTWQLRVRDCAGHTSTSQPAQISPCIDVTPPTNSVSSFDARPTGLGVWLTWNWGTTDAAEMKVFRSATTANYPVYASTPAYYTGSYPPPSTDWTEVVDQTSTYTTPAGYHTSDPHHVDGGVSYWLDRDPSWTHASPARDIYRYVTFTKDAAGNWSNAGASAGQFDHSTNYWLGDFAPAPTDGAVNTSDLQDFSAAYFQTGHNIFDIGPENHENGYGKGIPTPDGMVDFLDLVPFSFNFGVAGDGGFMIQQPTKPFNSLDNIPVVNAAKTSDEEITLNSTFTVDFALSGNDHSVKDMEVQATFDPEVLELVSITAGGFEVTNGLPWSTAKAVEGEAGKIVMAAAAMGETAVINENGTLATATFRWKSKTVAHTNIEMTSVKMSDGAGANVSGTGSTLVIGADGILPTAYGLFQNYPNPFNPTTTINFDLKEGGFVKLSVYNVLGQQVATLVNNTMEAGHQSVSFDAHGLSSGLYIYKIEVNGFTALHKMMLMR
jgi:hypothetical protein